MAISPILLEVFKNRFASIAEEMGVTLTQTAFSPNIKERRDLSCAVFDAAGDMIAQAAHIPVHLGSMPLSVRSAMEAARADGGFAEGDMVMLNDPFRGGTHLPDITIVAPVFAEEGAEPAFYVANRAHHADVGGMAAGSMPLSTSLFQEGLIIPPVRIIRQGEIDRGLLRLVLANVRTPAEREGDFAAQFNANRTGVRRLGECLAKYGRDTCAAYAAALMDYAERITRRTIGAIPDGTYHFEDFLDDDGLGTTAIPIRLALTVKGDAASLDFRECGDQAAGSVNAVRAITLSAVLYVLRALTKADIPANAGCLRPVEILTRPGSVVDARFPAAVAGGNVETSQRIVDVILGALAQALPGRIPAASQGTMNNITIGGAHGRDGRPFAYYETLAGGMGASPRANGESAVHSHMTNTLNTPVEALEYAYPFRVRQYAVRRGTGGDGARRGGDGLVREIELLADAEVTVLSERRVRAPYGLSGGQDGATGRNVLVRDETPRDLPGKFHLTAGKGDRIRMETPGGGGHGEE
ncbi:hydantoinase B/oxoprolinase family protein [Pseudodesulfovibrio sp.]|uniref:hydantoinase B/oxoprolinase family protein n=1 Tax=Pseudodesulfovibrio sp. TaxID=2035812 RepID=UPI0026398E63|nr:hydantoinase B/oxoprolinase family protein [Pseudodesulfovibrio sp.]MDD3313531.1 hydantoinase B/oxoprolinase family protein [Pseudodesulfovibrio sp.]